MSDAWPATVSTALLHCWPAVGVVTVRTGWAVSTKLAVRTKFDDIEKVTVALLVTMPLLSVQLTKVKPGLAAAVME